MLNIILQVHNLVTYPCAYVGQAQQEKVNSCLMVIRAKKSMNGFVGPQMLWRNQNSSRRSSNHVLLVSLNCCLSRRYHFLRRYVA
jgi:hypothetical protein